MNSGMYAALSGNLVAMKRLDVISNNLANANTPGFKKDRLMFESLLAGATPQPSNGQPVLAENSFYTDFSPGPVKQTGNTLDMALEAEGFFVVDTPEGRAYTRQGNFQRDGSGRLVNQDGYAVMGNGPISVTGSKVVVNERGAVSVDGVQIATLEIVDFPKPYALQKVGNGLFIPADPQAATQPVRNPQVKQGYMEESN